MCPDSNVSERMPVTTLLGPTFLDQIATSKTHKIIHSLSTIILHYVRGDTQKRLLYLASSLNARVVLRYLLKRIEHCPKKSTEKELLHLMDLASIPNRLNSSFLIELNSCEITKTEVTHLLFGLFRHGLFSTSLV